MHYILEPEVAGGFGNNVILDATKHPPDVSHLHYELDGWLGDDLLECFPCYIVTERLMLAICDNTENGYVFADVEISTSEVFKEIYLTKEIPKFHWLKVTGRAGSDDFGISSKSCLVVSEKVLGVMRNAGNLNHCEISTYLNDE